MKYFITGFPGTGKTAIAEALRKKGYLVYDIDREKALARWVNKHSGEIVAGDYIATPEFYENHDFCWDREYLKKILEEAPNKPTFVVGITSNQTQEIDLFTKVFLLKAEQDLLRQRMTNRKSIDPTKKNEDVNYGFDWKNTFEREMLKHGAIPIDASFPIEETILEIEKEIIK